mmetsp:Transcript_35155/g.83974  ORF Transcript_35155/g.83974 Transcript_35155/m.83974 type:complete len:353 (-) Transcript_35155:316-1374(-)
MEEYARSPSFRIPVADAKDVSLSDFEAYRIFQALHIRGAGPDQKREGRAGFEGSDVLSLFDSLDKDDKASWCVESTGITTSPADFLNTATSNLRGYCSFLIQHSKDVKQDLEKRLPITRLPESMVGLTSCNHGPCIWMFFGKNPIAQSQLEGRPEHTDSVSHDGTWHYQLSGTKVWRIRATEELQESIAIKTNRSQSKTGKRKRVSDDSDNPGEPRSKTYYDIECKEGDIILLNTRLWWHSTFVPPQARPSISYARDIYFRSDVPDDAPTLGNLDGTYAAEDIESDTVLFTEHGMPDCELHRSKDDPNCRLVELEDESGDSYMAIVSSRVIKAGEFFTLEDSDDEDDSGLDP